MEYSFNIDHAKSYGVEEAIMLKNFIFWIKTNKANRKHSHDEKWWTYNSAKDYVDIFPFWNEGKIQRIIHSLINQKVIKTGNYNKTKYDRTRWFCLVDESMLEFDSHSSNTTNGSGEINKSKSKVSTNGSGGNDAPIPDTITDTITDKNLPPIEGEGIERKEKTGLVRGKSKYSPKVIALAKHFYKKVLLNDPKFNKSTSTWLEEMDQLIRFDKRTEEEIRSVIDWATTDNFWKANILSPKNLREEFTRLLMRKNTIIQKKDKQPYRRILN